MTTITGETTVQQLLAAHPSVAEVLLAHGMCESCQEDSPPVPLGHFANKHCDGDLPGLLAELARHGASHLTD